jgi:hypothetical protein
MPEKQTLERARRAKREGKSSSTQAGEFVREEIHHIREGKHGARSTKQAIAIGLSKARREVEATKESDEFSHGSSQSTVGPSSGQARLQSQTFQQTFSGDIGGTAP